VPEELSRIDGVGDSKPKPLKSSAAKKPAAKKK